MTALEELLPALERIGENIGTENQDHVLTQTDSLVMRLFEDGGAPTDVYREQNVVNACIATAAVATAAIRQRRDVPGIADEIDDAIRMIHEFWHDQACESENSSIL